MRSTRTKQMDGTQWTKSGSGQLPGRFHHTEHMNKLLKKIPTNSLRDTERGKYKERSGSPDG